MPHHAIVSDFQVGDLSIKTRLKRGEEWPINGPGEGQFPRWRRGANIWREVTNPWNGSKRPRNRTVNEKGIAMKRCAQCHGPLGLGVRSRNVWNGRWWDHVRYCSTHCEALHELERYKARSPARREGLAGRNRHIPAVGTLIWIERATSI